MSEPLVTSGVPWFDDHGACLLHQDGRSYLFGECKTDDLNLFAGFSCCSSADLVDWWFERTVLPMRDRDRLLVRHGGRRCRDPLHGKPDGPRRPVPARRLLRTGGLTGADGTVISSVCVTFYSKVPDTGYRYVSPALPRGDYRPTVTVLGEPTEWSDKSGTRFGSVGTRVVIDRALVLD